MAAQEWAASRSLVMAGTDGGRDVNPGCRKCCQALEMISHFVGGMAVHSPGMEGVGKHPACALEHEATM